MHMCVMTVFVTEVCNDCICDKCVYDDCICD